MSNAQLKAFFLLSLFALAFILIVALSNRRSLNIKAKRVGNGQYGDAHFADRRELRTTYKFVEYDPKLWRGIKYPDTRRETPKKLPVLPCGVIVGTERRGSKRYAIVDCGDTHTLMQGAAGTGKTTFFLYPNLEYACACGMSFVATDTKGDLARSYGSIAQKYYGYNIDLVDLRNPTRSNGRNLLQTTNKYMDIFLQTGDVTAKAAAEKHAKIIAKSIITNNEMQSMGQNAYFYDSAEGLLAATILLVSEYCDNGKRHIVTVFKVIMELLKPVKTTETDNSGKQYIEESNEFKELIALLPPEHKARWLSAAALNTSKSTMASVLTTALSRLLSFIDSEVEQILCFDSPFDIEKLAEEKTAMFIVLPEEDNTKYFMVSLILQQVWRELIILSDAHHGKLPKRFMMYLDEIGTIPKIDGLDKMFSAIRSRGVSIVAIIQSAAQLEKNYGKYEAKTISDNCQIFIYGGFSPGSTDADALSKALGTYTALSGSISDTGGERVSSSRSLQMISRPLMMSDQIRRLPPGKFIVARTGAATAITDMPLYTKWGITVDEEYVYPERGIMPVYYGSAADIRAAIACEKFSADSDIVNDMVDPYLQEQADSTPDNWGALMNDTLDDNNH